MLKTSKIHVLLDVLIVLAMGCLLFYGVSWQIFEPFTDPGKYECYVTAFWHGVSALKTLGPETRCQFVTQPPTNTTFFTNNDLIHFMQVHHFPTRIIFFIASQAPTQPLHALPHEYPLLTIIPFSFGLVTTDHWYQVAFAIAMALLTGVVYVMLRIWRSQKAAIAFALFTVVAGWATAEARFDIIPAGFTLGALLLAERKKWRWAYALLAIATMFKFYPIVLVPAFFIAQYRARLLSWHKWWRGIDVFVLVCATITAISLLLSVEGTLDPLGYFGDRPIQAESTASSLLWIGSFFGFPLHYNIAYNSLNMLSPLSSIVSPMMTVLCIIGLAYVYWMQWRGKLSLAMSLVLTLLVVVCTGKVFSPQYLLWITPFVAYVGEFKKWWLLGWAGIGLLTTWIFPYIYIMTDALLKVPTVPLFHPAVFIRNACLVAFLVILLYRYTLQRRNAGVLVGDTTQRDVKALASMIQAD